MITFSDIYEAMRKEKYAEELQILPGKFLEHTSEYFSEKKEFLAKQEDLFSDMSLKTKKKLENAMASFRDLLRIRKKKILNLAFVASEAGISKRDFENLLSFEKDLYEEIVRSLEKADDNMNSDMLGNSKNGLAHQLVRFIEDVPEFLNFSGEEVGPFGKEELANLEKEIVEILVKDGRVELVDID